MARFNEVFARSSAKEALSSRLESRAKLLTAIIANFGMCAEHGQPGPLNDFYNAATAEDKVALKAWYDNFVRQYGSAVESTSNPGEYSMKGFLSLSVKEGWKVQKNADSISAKESKANFMALTDDQLSAIQLAKPKAEAKERDTSYDLSDFHKAIAKLVEKAAKEGIPESELRNYNDGLGSFKVNVAQLQIDRADKVAKQRKDALALLAKTGGVPEAFQPKVEKQIVSVNKAKSDKTEVSVPAGTEATLN